MKKPQFITLISALAVLGILWAFGSIKPDPAKAHEGHQHAPGDGHDHGDVTSSFSIDSALNIAKDNLPAASASRLNLLEQTAGNASGDQQKIHVYHQISQFWRDTAKIFIPFAWYTAESARLENSEKNLNFAGHLFLNNLQNIENADVAKWMALQAKDLFERSLKINPNNDSAKVGLGSTYLFGGISTAPMEGIAKIREVVDKDSTNLYAQMTLAMGSLMSGQTDKAKERLETIMRIDPQNIQAILLLADIYEKQGKKPEAIQYYQKALSLATDHAEMRAELEKRIDALNAKN